MAEKRIEIGVLARDVSVRVATQVANTVAADKTNELLTASAQAEAGRVSAEQGRVTAEQGRVTAEQDRVAAETARSTEFATWEDEIDSKITFGAGVRDGTLQAGYADSADSLTPYGESSGADDTTPFAFQSIGGSSDVGVKAYLRELRGNSVAFSQLYRTSDSSATTLNGITHSRVASTGAITVSGTSTSESSFSIGFIPSSMAVAAPANHKYLVKYNLKGTAPAGNDAYTNLFGYNSALVDKIFPSNANVNGTTYAQIIIASGATVDFSIQPQIFDLTLMFGAGNEPTSALEFNRLFPKPYYEYNAGTLLSSKVNGIKNVGYNAFDGELIHGNIDSDGAEQPSNYYARSKNPIKVIAGQTYTGLIAASGIRLDVFEYDEDMNFIAHHSQVQNESNETFALNSNCHYLKLRVLALENPGTTVVSLTQQIAIHLTWDGSRTGYEPYESNTYQLPNVELRSAGEAYDELKPDGTLIRRIGAVDLGTLDWSYSSNYQVFITANLQSLLIKPIINSNIGYSRLLDGYGYYLNRQSQSDQFINNPKDISVSISDNGNLQLKNLAYTDAATFKAAMSGVYLYYELAEPAETQDDDYKYQEIQDIDDFGTQEFLYDSGIDIPVPQGNELFYPVDYKAFIDSLGGREDIEYDASEIVSHDELASVESRIPALPSDADDGSYNLTATKSGTAIAYAWVKIEE